MFLRRVAIIAIIPLILTITVTVPTSANDNPSSGATASEITTNSVSNGYQKFTTNTPQDSVGGTNQNTPNMGQSSGFNALRWPWSGNCDHRGESDNIHLTNNRTEVSVHGWWLKLNDDCPAKADVWVELQAWSCVFWYGSWNCSWYTLDRSPTKRVFSGGGSGNRVNARNECASRSMVTFRSVVDVDIPGEVDSSEKWYKKRSLACYPIR